MKATTAVAILSYLNGVQALLDANTLATKYFGNDSPWYADRIPFFESSDSSLTDVYYYRWKIFRSHQRDLGANGYISTEFLNDVSWQTKPWASLNDATGFHLQEGRWCRDRRFKEDYATFILGPNSNTRQFSESVAGAIWQGYLVDGVAADATARLNKMQGVYNAWADSFDTSKTLYWVEPLRDATEYTISSIDASNGTDGFFGGMAFRPSINSYQYANARAIANLAALQGGMASTVTLYNNRATALKSRVQTALWNSTFQHFIDRYQVNNTFVTYWNPIRGRELVGMVPWTHDLPDDSTTYAQAWKHILDTTQLAGPKGLRTVEPSYQYYMRQYRYEGASPECQWNGPIWPFQTTQVLTGLANFLDHYTVGSAANLITKADYTRLLQQYAALHYIPSTSVLDLQEDYYPDTGAPIVGLARSHHYFHSGFIDNILSGFVGIRPAASDDLEVYPLANAATISYFRADRILYHGHTIAVQWDATGSRYGSAGLIVEVDGAVVATSSTLSRVKVSLARASPPAIDRPIAKSIKLSTDTAFPAATCSVSGTSATSLYQTIDGRVMFWSETTAANGWSTPAGTGASLWFNVNFGAPTSVKSAEIAFYADATQKFDVPLSYKVQAHNGVAFADVAGAEYSTAVANGITKVTWTATTTNQTRLVFTPKAGKFVRLVEFKLY